MLKGLGRTSTLPSPSLAQTPSFLLMSSPSAEDVINAFVRIVRDKLEQGERVDVPELGTFDVEHRPSQVKEDNAGDSYMAPPRNVVTFEPEQ